MSPANDRPRIHPMTYAVCRKDSKRPLQIHHRRDAAAALEILMSLYDLGYRRGEQIIAQPPLDPKTADPRERLKVDRSGLRPGDLILQTTRPPLHDANEGAMKQVERVYTDLEDDVFAAWRGVFEHCKRPLVALQAGPCRHMAPGFETRANMNFCQRKKGAPYTYLRSRLGKRREKQAVHDRTAAFFLRVDELWRGGPGLVGAFAMDGIANMVWAWHLGRDFAFLLEKPGFAIVEMTIGEVPERPTDLAWARTWKPTEILRLGPDEMRAGSASGIPGSLVAAPAR